jgi:hypothetical protein
MEAQTNPATPPVDPDQAIIDRVEALTPDERLMGIREFRKRQMSGGPDLTPDETRYALALIRSTRALAAKPKTPKAKVKELSLDDMFGA